MLGRIFDGDEFVEDRGFDGPVAGFPSCAMLGLHQEVADIGEGGGAFGRDAIGGESLEEFAEDVIDINLGDEIAGGAGEFFDEIVFAMKVRRWMVAWLRQRPSWFGWAGMVQNLPLANLKLQRL
jgi:hypothetical protein